MVRLRLTSIVVFAVLACTSPTSSPLTSVAGTDGLTGGGSSGAVTLGVDSSIIQRRVSGTCAIGSFVTAVNADGTVSCANGGAGDITEVSTTAGLTGGATSGSVTLSIDTSVVQSRVTGTCSAGTFATAVGANGQIVCAAGAAGTLTALTAGDGLTGGGTSGAVAVAIADGGVTTAHLANGSVTMAKTAFPAGQGSARVTPGSAYVFPLSVSLGENAGTCFVTVSAVYIGLPSQAAYRVRPVIFNAANQEFAGLHWGYSSEWFVANVPQFPSGSGGRQATSTGVLNVTGGGPWNLGCNIEGLVPVDTRCDVSFSCH